jgi:hypothetical protein
MDCRAFSPIPSKERGSPHIVPNPKAKKSWQVQSKNQSERMKTPAVQKCLNVAENQCIQFNYKRKTIMRMARKLD